MMDMQQICATDLLRGCQGGKDSRGIQLQAALLYSAVASRHAVNVSIPGLH